jgi:hypothetical protein
MTDVSTRDLSAEVAAASADVERLKTAQMRAEAAAEAADAEYARALAKLKDEFDVDTVESAAVLLRELDGRVNAELDIVQAKLAEANGS